MSQSAVSTSCNLMNNYARWPIALVKGQANTVWDDTGKAYLDFTSGIAVTSLGHCPPQVTKALQEQLETLWHCSNLFRIPVQEELAAKLAEVSGLDKVFFCNSGAEANEGAIKIARRYAQKIKGEERYEVITFHQSFHGRTLATLTATGQDKVKDGFLPLPEGFISVPYNDLEALKAVITERTCGILMELVQGEGGVHAADPAWVKAVRELCDEQGILFMVDEVQTGIGRTGTWFAFQQYGITPDVVSVAKGLGSGFPIGAVLAVDKVAEAFSPGTHGTTFGGNPLATTAGVATLATIEQENLLARVNQLNEYLVAQLQKLQQTSGDKVTHIRGRGLLIGVELTQPAADIITYAREKGVLLHSAGPNVIRLLPSFVTTEQEIDTVINVLTEALLQG
ncbi:acetylornithine transaminase [Brevibacillus dissolubilis]|uniref:acetylornithine transaminase n=1 Tax=Brevibacillus dissolubilis TaxID=1844116 RepID=UPI001116DF45|nr:acetylornithine transaminase [Brevibacillus dissolubilis]